VAPASRSGSLEAAFGATVLHHVGEGDEIVGATSRTLLVVDSPVAVMRQAVRAGAIEISPVADEHGWLVGRISDPFGRECEIGTPLGAWPPR